MNPKIKIADLKPGDVFLFHGNSFIAKAIRTFDGTKFNHAAIFDGKDVIEAVGTGVETHSIKQATADAEFVGVFRLVMNGKILGDSALPFSPVGKVISKFQKDKDRYAYEEILLLAVLATTRKIPIPMLRWILDHAASILARITSLGKEPMICSELVYRCFLGAGNAYTPKILGAGLFNRGISLMTNIDNYPLANEETDSPEALKMKSEFLELYSDSKGADVEATYDIRSLDVRKPNPNFVTPGDLFKSPNLKFQGYLSI